MATAARVASRSPRYAALSSPSATAAATPSRNSCRRRWRSTALAAPACKARLRVHHLPVARIGAPRRDPQRARAYPPCAVSEGRGLYAEARGTKGHRHARAPEYAGVPLPLGGRADELRQELLRYPAYQDIHASAGPVQVGAQ